MRFRSDPLPKIEGYDRLEEIGRGGFSRVYTAHQIGFERRVALKVITRNIGEDDVRAFRQEQRLTGRLDGHPNIVRVYDAGVTKGGQPYLAMEYLEHGTVMDRVRRHGPYPVDEALVIGVKLACAINSAHELNIVHRDVKPQNVLLSPYVGPVLADFGIAGILGDHRSDPEAFSVLHAAPEVLAGDPSTEAADIYSVASTLYELLAGRAPFHDPHAPGLPAFLQRADRGVVPPIDRPDLPADADAAIVHLLSRDPDGRPPTGFDLADRLRSVQAHLGLDPTPRVGKRPTSTMHTDGAPLVPPTSTPPSAAGPRSPAGPAVIGADTLAPPDAAASRIEDLVAPGSNTATPPAAAGAAAPTPTHTISRASKAPTVEGPAPSPEPDQRRPRLIVLGVAALLAVIGITGVALRSAWDGGGVADVAPSTSTTARSVSAPTSPATTSAPSAVPVVAPCPSPEPGLDDVRAPADQRATAEDVVVEFDGGDIVVHFVGEDAPDATYVLFGRCRPESGTELAVTPLAARSGAEPHSFRIEDVDQTLEWCFGVGVVDPAGGTRLGNTGNQFRCA